MLFLEPFVIELAQKNLVKIENKSLCLLYFTIFYISSCFNVLSETETKLQLVELKI